MPATAVTAGGADATSVASIARSDIALVICLVVILLAFVYWIRQRTMPSVPTLLLYTVAGVAAYTGIMSLRQSERADAIFGFSGAGEPSGVMKIAEKLVKESRPYINKSIRSASKQVAESAKEVASVAAPEAVRIVGGVTNASETQVGGASGTSTKATPNNDLYNKAVACVNQIASPSTKSAAMLMIGGIRNGASDSEKRVIDTLNTTTSVADHDLVLRAKQLALQSVGELRVPTQVQAPVQVQTQAQAPAQVPVPMPMPMPVQARSWAPPPHSMGMSWAPPPPPMPIPGVGPPVGYEPAPAGATYAKWW